MSLISCLRKSSFDSDEQKFIINKSKLLQDKGISEKEANIQAVKALQDQLTSSLKDIYNQLELSTEKQITTSKSIDSLKPLRIVYRKNNLTTLEQEDYDKLSKEEKEEYKEVVKPAQVLLTWNFKDKSGKRLNIEDFKTFEGYIDLTKVPKDILTQFGFRIPCQGHNSMSLIEVVGFLPEVMGDVIITPRNFVTQMGSDFDVDKLFVYDYYLNEKEGKLSKDDNIKNKIVDIHKAVLFNPAVFNSIVKPLDLGKLKYKTKEGKEEGIAVDLKNLNKKPVYNYLNPDYSKDKYLQSVDGKTMVGINALSSTFSTLIQGHNLYLQQRIIDEKGKINYIPDHIVFGTDTGKTLKLSKLSSPYTYTGRKKNEVNSAYLSAAVDNEKDPILTFINSNSYTSSVESLLKHLGLEEELSLFIDQPAIVEYVSLVRRSRGSITNERGDQDTQLGKVLEKYTKLVGKFADDPRNNEDYPLTPRDFKQVLDSKAPKGTLTNSQIQYLTILKFAKIKSFGDPLNSVAANTNIESKGIGRTLIHVADKRSSIDKIPNISSIANITNLLGEWDGNKLEPNTLSGYAIVNSLLTADDKLNDGQLLPYSLGTIQDLLKQFEEVIGYTPTTDDKIDFWKGIKAYAFTGYYTTDERERLFFDRETNKSLNTRIKELQNKDLKNNPFILRLDLTQSDRTGKKPSYIFYNSAKEENIEELEIYQAFIDLVNSPDPKIKAIGEDLVKYFLINGGDQQAREWGKYINSKFLDNLGITSYLNTINFSHYDTTGYFESGVSTVLLQYLQHNPYSLTRLKEESFKDIKSDTANPADANELILPFASSGKVRELNKTGISYLPIFSISGSKSSTGAGIFLFKSTTEEGNKYIRIPNLGAKFFQEYQKVERGEIVSSLLNKKFKVEPIIPIYKEKEEKELDTPTQIEINPVENAEILPLVNTTLGESLKNINSDPNHIALAKLFLKVENLIGKVPITTDATSNPLAAGIYNSKEKKITINPTNVNNKKVDYEKVILTEATHAVVGAIMDRKVNPTSNQLEAIASLNSLYHNVRNQVLKGELEHLWESKILKEFDRIYTKVRKEEQLTDKEEKFIRSNSAIYYGLSATLNEKGEIDKDSSEDFIHEALLQYEFMKRLNQVALTQDKSVLQRLQDLIKLILEEFRRIVGFKSDSALEQAFIDVVRFVEQPNEGENKKASPNQRELFAIANNKEKEDTNYSRIVNDFKSRLASIDKDISKAFLDNNKELATRLIARSQQVREEMKTLIKENSFGSLVKQANIDLNYVDNILKQDKISLQDIRYSAKVLATWSKITDPVYGIVDSNDIKVGTKRFEDSEKIVQDAEKLSKKLSQIELGTLYNQIKKEVPSTLELTKEDLLVVKDISLLQAQFRDISTSDNIILSVASKWIRNANYDAKTDATDIIESLDKVLENLYKNTLYKQKGYKEIFGQEDVEGNYTGEVVSALTREYFDTRDRLYQNIENSPNKVFRKQAREKYFNWIRDNHIIVDIRKFYKEGKDGLLEPASNDKYLNTLSSQLKEDYEKVLQQAKENVSKYNEELQLQIDSHKDDPNGFRIIEKWRAQTSPLVYLTNLIEGYKEQIIEGKPIHNQGWRFVTRRALTKWEDSKYNVIQTQPELKAFYDYFKDTMDELIHYLPYSYREQLSSTDIPSINKDLIEKLRDQGVGSSMDLTWSKLLENISVTDNDSETGLIDPVTGKLEKNFKIKYLQNINPEDKSYDLGRVLKIFALEVLEYKHKSQVEDLIRLSESVLSKALEKTSTASGETITDKFGQITTTKGLRNLLNQFEYAVEAFYSNRRDTKEGITKKEILTPENKKKLAEEITKIKEKNLDEPLEKAAIDAATKRHTRYFSFGRLGDTLLQYVQIKGMGWNIFGGFNNLSFGFISNHNWAAGERDFTQKELLRATGVMLSYNKEVEKKVASFMVGFDTVKELNEVAFKQTTDNNKVRKGISKLAPYELYRKGEYFVQGQTMVSMLMHQKIKVTNKETKEESELSLYDAFESFGKLHNIYESKPEWEKKGKELAIFKNKLDQVIKTIHGNYDPNSPVLMKKKVIGRALLQFRSWVAEGIATRFDTEKYDVMLQRSRKGRFRTLVDLGIVGSLTTLGKQAIHSKTAFSELDKLNLTEDQKATAIENMKKNLNELYQKVSLTILYLILGNLNIDKDDWKTRLARNYTVNSLLRLSDDIEFYYSPIAAENITRSVLPATTLIVDGNHLLESVWDTIQGEGTYKSGTHAGESKILYKGAKVIPFGSSVVALINKGKSQESFRK